VTLASVGAIQRAGEPAVADSGAGAGRTVAAPGVIGDEPTPMQPCASGTVLAFDFGERRIGVAMGESLLGIAHPLTTIDAKDSRTRFAAIAALIAEWQPALLLVGLPAHMDGTEHEMSRRCRKFARSLEGRYHVPVQLVDERLTSWEAGETLHQAGVPGKKHKAALDQVAAQLILQSYFDHAAA
jgi:putative Holliday junction resolvase